MPKALKSTKLIFTLILLPLLVSSIALSGPSVVIAQSGCALRINEVMYRQDTDANEWVELYVALDITADTTFFISDQESGATFEKTFTLTASDGDPIQAGTYIVVHNDGSATNDGTEETIGIYTATHYYIGNSLGKLNNGGDDLVLYGGTDASGTACDYMAFASGSAVGPTPAGFTWNTSTGDGSGACSNPSSSSAGTSVSLDPNGGAGNDACDWAESGKNSTSDPGSPATMAPNSQGWNNNTSPTAIKLRVLNARAVAGSSWPRLTPLVGLSLMVVGAGLVVLRRRRPR